MNKINLKDYTDVIYHISITNNVDTGVARDYFVNSLEAGAEKYPDGIAKVDYVTLGDTWKQMSLDEQTATLDTFEKAMDTNGEKLAQLYNAGKYKDMIELMNRV